METVAPREDRSAWESLDRALEASLRPVRELASARVVLFSGGPDSGLLAWELRASPSTTLFTAGAAGSADLAAAARAAPLIGLPWTSHEVAGPELDRLVKVLAPELEPVPGPRRGILVALASALATAPPGAVVCGQGADELFLGYAHFRGLDAGRAGQRSDADLARLLEDDWPRTARIAASLGRTLVAPYLDPGFVRAVREVPVEARLPGELTKPLFRRWASHRGLPEPLATAPKRAIQYGSGIDRLLRHRGHAARGTAPEPPAVGAGN